MDSRLGESDVYGFDWPLGRQTLPGDDQVIRFSIKFLDRTPPRRDADVGLPRSRFGILSVENPQIVSLPMPPPLCILECDIAAVRICPAV
jgi:hypothetical protein